MTLSLLLVLPAAAAHAQDSPTAAPDPDTTSPAPVPEPTPSAAPDTTPVIEPIEAELEAAPPEEPSADETLVVVGSRVKPRSDTDTPSPVDVLSAQDLQKTGTTEVGRALQMLAPSFNFSSTTVSDGTDLIRPATLRGLGPDQVLVLVNGKRRHQIALVNVQETIGKGSSGYDLNAIPMAAIERIEILRDGAAAQYGSDAIAGVINIVLKKRVGLQAEAGAGRYYESDSNVYGFLDTFGASTNGGFDLGGRGVLNVTLDYRERGLTNRAGVATLEGTMGQLIGDWYDNGKPVRRLRIGDAQARTLSAFYNGEYKLSEATTLYSFGGISRRNGESSGVFRGPGHPRVPLELYPRGFLPTLLTRADDISVQAGVRSDLSEHWKLDASLGWGRSVFNFGTKNSVNVSWFYEPDASGNPRLDSPTKANDGTLIADMLTANVDFTAKYPMPWDAPLFFATGAAARIDRYQIEQGDPVSWSYGRSNDPSVNILNTSVNPPAPAEAGIQGFPGFGPSTVVDKSRPSVAAYIDGETDLRKNWMVGLAGRFESIDFKNQAVTGKLTTRFDLAEFLSLRGTISNGFRAPGVQQLYYRQTLTNLVNGTLVDTSTIPNNSPVARAFGIDALKPERSFGASVGAVLKPDAWLSRPSGVSLTVDLYFLKIKDRIVLSEPINGMSAMGAMNAQTQQLLADNNLAAAQFFTNAVDTTTLGADVVGAYDFSFTELVDLKLSAALSLVKTKVDDVHSQSSLINATDLFSDTQRLRMERGQPREKSTLAAVMRFDEFALRLATNYFGSVSGQAFSGVRVDWSGKWITDAAFTYNPRSLRGLQFTLGANNLFNVFPDDWAKAGGKAFADTKNAALFYQAGFTYGWETLPFGINGGYYYLNVAYSH